MAEPVVSIEGAPGKHDRPVTSIAAMEPGEFWLRARSIGLSQQEIDDLVDGKQLPDSRAAQLYSATQKAISELNGVDCPGPQFWMSLKRAMC